MTCLRSLYNSPSMNHSNIFTERSASCLIIRMLWMIQQPERTNEFIRSNDRPSRNLNEWFTSKRASEWITRQAVAEVSYHSLFIRMCFGPRNLWMTRYSLNYLFKWASLGWSFFQLRHAVSFAQMTLSWVDSRPTTRNVFYISCTPFDMHSH